MIIVGIDPGMKCGWAVLDAGKLVDSGVWHLKSKRIEGAGMRYVRLGTRIGDLLWKHRPDALGYEEVRRHPGTSAAHVYGAIEAMLAVRCELAQIPYSSVPVKTIKLVATGTGSASKAVMMAAFRDRFGREPETDDESDAAFVAVALALELERTSPEKPAGWREG